MGTLLSGYPPTASTISHPKVRTQVVTAKKTKGDAKKVLSPGRRAGLLAAPSQATSATTARPLTVHYPRPDTLTGANDESIDSLSDSVAPLSVGNKPPIDPRLPVCDRTLRGDEEEKQLVR